MLAFAMLTAIRVKANMPARPKSSPPLIRWSVQEIRRVATRLAQYQIQPAAVIAWSLWCRAHQAAAQQSSLKRNCSARAEVAKYIITTRFGQRWET